jgi:hypothetical protein
MVHLFCIRIRYAWQWKREAQEIYQSFVWLKMYIIIVIVSLIISIIIIISL